MAKILLNILSVSLVLLVLLVAGCSQMKGTRRPMSDGEKLFRVQCRMCHILPKPDEKQSDEWPAFLNAHSEDKDIEPGKLEKIVKFLQSGN